MANPLYGQNKDGDVQFLYRLIEEGASQSFGIYVAKLAGLPPSLLHRATEILHNLESENQGDGTGNISGRPTPAGQQLDFFPQSEITEVIPPYLKELEDELLGIDINNMTPVQVMNKMQNLQSALNQSKLQ